MTIILLLLHHTNHTAAGLAGCCISSCVWLLTPWVQQVHSGNVQDQSTPPTSIYDLSKVTSKITRHTLLVWGWGVHVNCISFQRIRAVSQTLSPRPYVSPLTHLVLKEPLPNITDNSMFSCSLMRLIPRDHTGRSTWIRQTTWHRDLENHGSLQTGSRISEIPINDHGSLCPESNKHNISCFRV